MKKLITNPIFIAACIVVVGLAIVVYKLYRKHLEESVDEPESEKPLAVMFAKTAGVKVWNKDKSGVMKVAKDGEFIGVYTGIEKKTGYSKGRNSIGTQIRVKTNEIKLEDF